MLGLEATEDREDDATVDVCVRHDNGDWSRTEDAAQSFLIGQRITGQHGVDGAAKQSDLVELRDDGLAFLLMARLGLVVESLSGLLKAALVAVEVVVADVIRRHEPVCVRQATQRCTDAQHWA